MTTTSNNQPSLQLGAVGCPTDWFKHLGIIIALLTPLTSLHLFISRCSAMARLRNAKGMTRRNSGPLSLQKQLMLRRRSFLVEGLLRHGLMTTMEDGVSPEHQEIRGLPFFLDVLYPMATYGSNSSQSFTPPSNKHFLSARFII